MRNTQRYIVISLFLLCLCVPQTYSQRATRNQLEFGVQGGMMYYVGDAHPKMFQDVREVYGAEMSYLFNYRWSLMLQGVTGRIAGKTATEYGLPDPKGEMWTNRLVNIDVVARFNFLPFGVTDKYDLKIKPFTPYIFAGIGVSMHTEFTRATAYIPVGVGFRWVCTPHLGMFIAVQNNICLGDNLEPVPGYDNIHGLNGANPLNFDMTGSIQFGIVFEFVKEKKICKFCSERY